MKRSSVHCSVLVFLLSVLLDLFSDAEASLTAQREHARTRRVAIRGAGKGTLKGKEKAEPGSTAAAESDADDDDDDDDDDDEDAATPAAAKPASGAAASKETKAPGNPRVAEIEKELAANLAEQADLKSKVKALSDQSKSDQEIDASAKLVANETESKALAGMIAKMWKEMRMFELPSFALHVEEEIHHLKRDENRLRQELAAAKGTASGVNAANPSGQLSKDLQHGPNYEDKEAQQAASNVANEQEGAEGADRRFTEPVQQVAGQAEKTTEPSELTKWSFWHMDHKRQLTFLISSLVYLVFGVLFAKIYQEVRARHPEYLDASTVPAPQDGNKGFSNGLFSCFSAPNVSVIACLCPCLRWADTVSRMTDVSMRATRMTYWKAFFLMFGLMLLHPYTLGITTAAIWLIGTYYRQQMRKRYKMDRGGSTVVLDCLSWMCCQCCVIVQESREEAARSKDGNALQDQL